MTDENACSNTDLDAWAAERTYAFALIVKLLDDQRTVLRVAVRWGKTQPG